MAARHTTSQRVALAVLLIALFLLVRSPGAATPSISNSSPRALGWIAPGTRIDDRAPEGWTHLIVKSRSELATGDLDELPSIAAPLTRLFFTAMVARVGPTQNTGRAPFQLEEVAIGLGTRIEGHDVVITGQTYEALGAEIDLLEQIILSQLEGGLTRIEQVARSGTMAIVDVPAVMFREGEHQNTIIRHVVLVDPREGRLATVVWRIDVDSAGAYRLAPRPAVLQAPDLVEVYPLHVDGSEVLAGIPSQKAYAGTRMPRGRAFAIPDSLRDVAGQRRLTADMARRIETEVRSAIGFAGAG